MWLLFCGAQSVTSEKKLDRKGRVIRKACAWEHGPVERRRGEDTYTHAQEGGNENVSPTLHSPHVAAGVVVDARSVRSGTFSNCAVCARSVLPDDAKKNRHLMMLFARNGSKNVFNNLQKIWSRTAMSPRIGRHRFTPKAGAGCEGHCGRGHGDSRAWMAAKSAVVIWSRRTGTSPRDGPEQLMKGNRVVRSKRTRARKGHGVRIRQPRAATATPARRHTLCRHHAPWPNWQGAALQSVWYQPRAAQRILWRVPKQRPVLGLRRDAEAAEARGDAFASC